VSNAEPANPGGTAIPSDGGDGNDVLTLLDSLQRAGDGRVWQATVADRLADVARLTLSDGRTAVLPRSEWAGDQLPAVGDVVWGCLLDDAAPPTFSTTTPALAQALLEEVVPETWGGGVRVMAVARRAGVRTKIAVAATAAGIDPIAACVGRQANRVKHVAERLGGERVDIIAWHDDPIKYIVNALAPASVLDVSVNGSGRYNVTVAAHQVAAAVGVGGQNSALAGRLVGAPLSITADDA
jgi:N utilization substance protein A